MGVEIPPQHRHSDVSRNPAAQSFRLARGSFISGPHLAHAARGCHVTLIQGSMRSQMDMIMMHEGVIVVALIIFNNGGY